jgi:hypothetical protein
LIVITRGICEIYPELARVVLFGFSGVTRIVKGLFSIPAAVFDKPAIIGIIGRSVVWRVIVGRVVNWRLDARVVSRLYVSAATAKKWLISTPTAHRKCKHREY